MGQIKNPHRSPILLQTCGIVEVHPEQQHSDQRANRMQCVVLTLCRRSRRQGRHLVAVAWLAMCLGFLVGVDGGKFLHEWRIGGRVDSEVVGHSLWTRTVCIVAVLVGEIANDIS